MDLVAVLDDVRVAVVGAANAVIAKGRIGSHQPRVELAVAEGTFRVLLEGVGPEVEHGGVGYGMSDEELDTLL